MSVPPTTNRKTFHVDHTVKTHSDKNKHVSSHTRTKIGTPGRTKSITKKSNSVENTNAYSKPNIKKCNSVDVHSKTTQTAESVRVNEPIRSRGATVTYGSHPHTKAQTHTDTHGKTAVHSRLDTHGKTRNHSTMKKSDDHQSRIMKHNKSEQDTTDLEQEDHTETNDVVTTAVSQDLEDVFKEEPNEDDSN